MDKAQAPKQTMEKKRDFWMIIRKGPNLMNEKKYALDILTSKGLRIGPGTIVYDMDLKKNNEHYIAQILIRILKEKRILLDTGSIFYESFVDDSDCEGILLVARIKGYVDEGLIEESYEVKKTYRTLDEIPPSKNTMDVHGFNVPIKQIEYETKQSISRPRITQKSPDTSNPYLETVVQNNYKEAFKRDIEKTNREPTKGSYVETIAQKDYRQSLSKAKAEADWEKLSEKKEGCFIATAVYGDYNCLEVLYLRRFRDEYLLKRFFGRLFVKFYYSWSPVAARYISRNSRAIKILKNFLDHMVIRIKKGYEK